MFQMSVKRSSSSHLCSQSPKMEEVLVTRSSRATLSLCILVALSCAACGWSLDDPPPYPDFGVSGEEADPNGQVEE